MVDGQSEKTQNAFPEIRVKSNEMIFRNNKESSFVRKAE